MVLVVETRYGGVYEGGPWGALDVRHPNEVPSAVVGADNEALTWWDDPTVPVGAGDDPSQALRRLRGLAATSEGSGPFEIGSHVVVANCTPSDWYPTQIGTIAAAVPLGPLILGPTCRTRRWVYEVDFEDRNKLMLPERYLRPHPR
ncbi:MAG: hypothetical protein AAF962_10695 [Actinomycetota bacterium]